MLDLFKLFSVYFIRVLDFETVFISSRLVSTVLKQDILKIRTYLISSRLRLALVSILKFQDLFVEVQAKVPSRPDSKKCLKHILRTQDSKYILVPGFLICISGY
jgi:hypothetical protein